MVVQERATVQNAEIARLLHELADLLEIDGADVYRVRAYRNAANAVESLPRSVADMLQEGQDLTELPGIGTSLAQKITQLVTTGRLAQLEELRQRFPPGLVRLLNVAGLGPKRVRALYQTLGIASLEALEQAAREGKIRQVPGFGETLERDILQNIEAHRTERARFKRSSVEQVVGPLVEYLKAGPFEQIVVAGSYRRGRETVRDLDIVVTSAAGAEALDYFVRYDEIEQVLAQGPTRATVALRAGLQVDVRAVPRESYGAALLYFTGSKAHGVALRELAIEQGYKLNEYGVFRGKERVAGETEEEVYRRLGLAFIPPELREQRGEIEAARTGTLPRLVELSDLRGDLQAHTTASDGYDTLEAMARAAQARGYEYLGITDHAKHIRVVKGLDPARLQEQMDQIDRLNERLEGFTVLKSCEVDILEDGTLALPDEALARLDLTVCSIHSHFDLSAEKQTERILRAMDNPHFNILGHPTGRLIGERPPYAVDLERVLEGARERGCFLEINAQPERLDLDDMQARAAKALGVKLAISSDAHHVAQLDFMRFGVLQARRGWLEADDVLNTRPWPVLKKLLKR